MNENKARWAEATKWTREESEVGGDMAGQEGRKRGPSSASKIAFLYRQTRLKLRTTAEGDGPDVTNSSTFSAITTP